MERRSEQNHHLEFRASEPLLVADGLHLFEKVEVNWFHFRRSVGRILNGLAAMVL